MTPTSNNPVSIISKILIYGFWGNFSYLMILITAQYIPLRLDVAFLNIKEAEISKTYYQIAFFTHVYTSIFTLLLGFFQFSKTLRIKRPKIHKSLGKLYICLVVLVTGPSGLVMGFHANGGLWSQIAFCLLSVLWIYFTFQAFRFARKKEFRLHEEFIYRSYALTLSAISLRLFKWLIVNTFSLPPMDTYQIVAWAGWVVNLMIAEIIIRQKKAVLIS